MGEPTCVTAVRNNILPKKKLKKKKKKKKKTVSCNRLGSKAWTCAYLILVADELDKIRQIPTDIPTVGWRDSLEHIVHLGLVTIHA